MSDTNEPVAFRSWVEKNQDYLDPEITADAVEIMAGIDRYFECLPTAEQVAERLRRAYSHLPTMIETRETLLRFQAAFRDRSPVAEHRYDAEGYKPPRN